MKMKLYKAPTNTAELDIVKKESRRRDGKTKYNILCTHILVTAIL